MLTQEGLAIESKAGYTSLTQSVQSQIAKDELLMQNPQWFELAAGQECGEEAYW